MPDFRSRITNPRFKLHIIWITAAALLCVVGVFAWNANSRPPLPKLPDPNGYVELVRAGRQIRGQVPKLDTATLDELRAFVDSHREILALMQRALTHECRVPVQYSLQYIAAATSRGESIRQAARLLAAEGKIAELEGRHADAGRSYLDLVDMGEKITRGGLLLDRLFGAAVQHMGIDGLQRLGEHMNKVEVRELLEKLQAINDRRESIDQLVEREREFTRRVHGWWFSGMSRLAEQSFQQAEKADERTQAKMNGLLEELAPHTR